MGTVFEFIPSLGFDPDLFAVSVGFTVDYTDSIWNDHDGLYRMAFVETLTAQEKREVIGILSDLISPDQAGGGSDARSTNSSIFMLDSDGTDPVAIRASGGRLEALDSAGVLVIVRAADPVGATDLVTKGYADGAYGGGGGGPFGLSQHVVSAPFVVTAGKSAIVSRYVEVAAGIEVEIGADGDLEVT